jgi:hypothetical protein
MTSYVNSKLKSYVLAHCCHHYGMTYCINTTASSALFLSCTHTHIKMCAHFVCDYKANRFPQFLFYVQVNMADTYITQDPTLFYLVPPMMETRVSRIYAVLTCKSEQHHNRDADLGQCHCKNLKLPGLQTMDSSSELNH